MIDDGQGQLGIVGVNEEKMTFEISGVCLNAEKLCEVKKNIYVMMGLSRDMTSCFESDGSIPSTMK